MDDPDLQEWRDLGWLHATADDELSRIYFEHAQAVRARGEWAAEEWQAYRASYERTRREHQAARTSAPQSCSDEDVEFVWGAR